MRETETAVHERAVVVATSTGQIGFATKQAIVWLREYFTAPASFGLLPAELTEWLQESGTKTKPLVARAPDKRLVVTALGDGMAEPRVFRLREFHHRDHRALDRRDLTPRESEVLHWLGQGKSNGQIAAILQMEMSTVKKHLQRIYPKLGVENRIEAASLAAPDHGDST